MGPHSYRKATIGSTREARRAGKKLAISATAISNILAPMKLAGSSGCRPKSNELTPRVTATADAAPRAVPSEIGRASCRERVEISVVAGAVKKKKKKTRNHTKHEKRARDNKGN